MNRDELRFREVGAAIARRREDRGLSQEELAHRIGFADHSHLSRIESGTKPPNLETIFHIADALGVNVYYFFTRI